MSFPENFICPITQSIMVDPVMCEDGITYERSAILLWLGTHNTSPVTRQYISSNLIPNLALRNTIQDYLKQNQFVPNVSNIQTNNTNVSNISNSVNMTYTQNYFQYEMNKYNVIKLNFNNTAKKNNIIVAVVDTSGSMGEGADVPGTESSGLSRLDLVKHTLNTITHSLNDNDMICIIKFSNSASVISDFIKQNRMGKEKTLENIKKLQPEGMTNLWAGIKMGIEKINSVYNDAYNVSMIVMTDGVSNSDPPRGIIPTLQDFIKTQKLKFTINTFGYGYNIDSNLLNQIASMSNGIFGFIPDATMVGTIFINMLSSILTGCVNNLEIITNSEILTATNLGMISVTQPVHIILKNNTEEFIKIKYDNVEQIINLNKILTMHNKEDIEQLMRIKLFTNINNTISSVTDEYLMNFKTELENINKGVKSEYIKNIIDDIYFDDPNKGQLTKAVNKRAWFEQWGNHYLKSIALAHKLERCITFKELAPQNYIPDDFKTEQKRIEQIFCDLPAPEPSNRYCQNTNSNPVSMSTYYVQSGGCFDGFGKVLMYDNKTNKSYYKSVSEIMKGDTVYCPQNSTKFARIVCVLKLKVNKEILMNNINGIKITPFHPVFYNDIWSFPKDINQSEMTQIDYMYDFVLDSGHIVKINNIDVITLGHGFDFNDVVKHDYFGDKIIDDLMKHESWDSGYICLDKYKFIRGEDMKIIGLEY
jgi:Mg-chelatase subunit ChlD